jgi:DNA/RNA-binding domain of Phe-tRNA-synthetase-like protein
MNIQIGSEVQDLLHGSLIGILEVHSLTVEKHRDALEHFINTRTDAICNGLKTKAGPHIVQSILRLHKQAGFDPARYRPSPAALLHRLKGGRGFPHINAVVDIINYCSLEYGLPICSYDMEKIQGDVRLSIGREGDTLISIGDQRIDLDKRLSLFDSHGPLGTLIADSKIAMITLETRSALCVVYASAAVHQEYIREVLSTIKDLISEQCEGSADYLQIIEI